MIWLWLSALALLLAASASAGQGWYFIVPPIGQYPTATEPGRIAGSAALPRWEQVGAFDTAQECERARTAKEAEAWAILRSVQDQDKNDMLVKMKSMTSAAMVSGRCVASDDPRLRQ
jgi:hypothetical protein